MITGGDVLSVLLNVALELILGYIVFFVISWLILIPGKNKLQNVTDENGSKESKKEIMKARQWMCLAWTFIIAAVNLYTLLF